MEATASTPIAVASSSTASNSVPRPNNTPIHPLSLPVMSHDLNMPINLHNRPLVSTSNSVNLPIALRHSTLAADATNHSTFPPIRPVNSAPNPKNTNRNTYKSTDPNTSRIYSPRRRRREQHIHENTNQNIPLNSQNVQAPNAQNSENTQVLQKVQNPQNARNKQNAQTAQPPQEYQPGRVLVTGYPAYTQPHDILEVFTKFGNVRIDKCNSFSATLTYPSEEQAKQAIGAQKRLHIYGHFLSVKPCSTKIAPEGPPSPKRDFSKSKQKSVIIEPGKIDLSGDFYAQLDKIMAAIRLNQEDINRISTLYRDLEYAFQAQWPGCKAVPFGSITTGLGIRTSDADCFMSLPPQHRCPQGNHVTRARRLLLQHPHVFAEILAIPRANTPIVKLYHVPTDTNCDLTFKTPLGARNSRLVAFLLAADPRVTPLAVLVKYWAKVHELSGTGRLTNYALTWMIIFYLQQPPLCILPSVAWLQRDPAHRLFVDCWDTGYDADSEALPRSQDRSTIADLLGGFFEYYAEFDFDELVICPFLGTPIKKSAFDDLASLPDEFALYRSNVLAEYVLPLRHQRPFCVQDPFEQCHNVASTITSKLALDIRTYFKFVVAAYRREKENGCSGFLRTMLLERPVLSRGKSQPEYRINLFPRVVNSIVGPDWRAVVRDLVTTMFERMIKVKLGKVEEKLNPDSRKEREKYTGSVTKPVWSRKKYNSIATAPDLGLEERQSLITEELMRREVADLMLQFQLTLTFCRDPRSAILAVRMSGGDLEAFREFGRFFISSMQVWFTQLLVPFSAPNVTDTPPRGAEPVDRSKGRDVNALNPNDGCEIVLTPSTNRTQEQPAKAEQSETTPHSEPLEVSQSGADVPPQGGDSHVAQDGGEAVLPHVDTPVLPHVDTVVLPHVDTPVLPHVDTVVLPHVDTVVLPHVDTVVLPHVDTAVLPHVDTVVLQDGCAESASK